MIFEKKQGSVITKIFYKGSGVGTGVAIFSRAGAIPLIGKMAAAFGSSATGVKTVDMLAENLTHKHYNRVMGKIK